MNWKNERELQNDLAEFLRECGFLTFTEISLNYGRVDIIAVKPHQYMNKDVRIYEVKNNRTTFKQDNKWDNYLNFCHRFYMACPKGLIKRDEVPKNIGLITRNNNSWQVVKAPIKNIPAGLSVDFVFSLLYRGYEESMKQRVLRDKIIADENTSLKRQACKIGWKIAEN